MSDIFKVLDGVLKEPHWAVVFKTLITIHILTRDSCGDRVLGYLAAQPNILNLSSFRDKTNTAAGMSLEIIKIVCILISLIDIIRCGTGKEY